MTTRIPFAATIAVLLLPAGVGDAAEFKVTRPPAHLKLAPFYQKYVDANGYPVVASAKVNDYALKEAAYLIDLMLAKRPDIKRAMVKSGSRMIVMGYREYTTDIPEYSKMKPKDFWNVRARGLGGSRTDPACSCAEENVLCFPGDPYSTECIVIHEFAHNIHLRGLVNIDPTFDERLKNAYKAAMKEGLWKGKYASVNHAEYWAEGVQSWFDNNRPPDHDHNHVDTRKELKEYDPRLAALCELVFGETKLVYTKPQTRLKGHLAGYDPSKAPTFRWPPKLQKIRAEIRRKAANRGKEKKKTRKSKSRAKSKAAAKPEPTSLIWPRFRGPEGSGVSSEKAALPTDIAPDRHLLWKVPLAKGHSSPAIVGDRIFLTAFRDRKLVTLALNATDGKTLWEHASPYKKLERFHRVGSPATPSVATDGEIVVSFFGSCGMTAYSLDGEKVWHTPMGPFNNQFGATSSPLIVGDRIVTIQDHDTGSYLAAYDKRSGKRLWKVERPNIRRNYGSPAIWQIEGKTQVVVAGTAHVKAYDVETGRLVWTVRGLCRVVSNTPVVGDNGILYVASTGGGSTPEQPSFDQLLKTADTNKNGSLERDELPKSPIKNFFGQFDRDANQRLDKAEYESIREIFAIERSTAMAIRPGGTSDITRSHVAWTNPEGVPRNASPLYHNGLLYAIRDGGILTTLDAKTGQLVKRGRLAGRGKYYSSPVVGDGKLYAVDDRGTLSVVSVGRDWKQLHTARFGEAVFATPAIAGGRIYLRTVNTLYCFDASK